ncbi:MAG: hypothetical protein F6K32_07885 [Desertifilum sp. SIO1I2]|nr:hypothetical protein [Desertifilum sp. SIO1I2]
MRFERTFATSGLAAIAIPALIVMIPLNAIAQSIEGQGTLSLQGRPDREIVRASITTDAENRTEMAFLLSDGNTIRFTGRYQGQTDSTQLGVTAIRLTHSGNADASGIVRVTYVEGSISKIEGEGLLDSQAFRFSFNRVVATRSNGVGNNTLGRGILQIQDRFPLAITYASVLTYTDSRTEITLQLSNGNIIRLSGESPEQAPNSLPNLLPVVLTQSGDANASGILNITYLEDRVQSISGRGSLDGQTFTLNYTLDTPSP